MCISLIPIIAEKYVLKRQHEVDNKINLSMKLSAVISIPCLFGLFFMAEPIMRLIFPGRFEGVDILKYLALSLPFIIITQTTTSILQSVGCYILPVINLFFGCVIKILLTLILVPMSDVNIYGAVIASVCAYVMVAFLNIITMRIKLGTKLKLYENFIKPAYAASFMMIVVLTVYNILLRGTGSNSVSCLISVTIGGIIYFVGILILRVFKLEEVRNKFRRSNIR